MKELKAVEILTLMQRVDDVSTRQMQKEINEALAELLETQAKLESLKEYCREQGSIIFAQNINNQCFSHNYSYNQGKVYVCQDILQKLEIDEEEGKEQ